jgi:hypothetical protein
MVRNSPHAFRNGLRSFTCIVERVFATRQHTGLLCQDSLWNLI